jgi:hypothetical protein
MKTWIKALTFLEWGTHVHVTHSRVHTHAQTHVHTNSCIRAHTHHTQTCMHVLVHAYTQTCINMHSCTHVHTYAQCTHSLSRLVLDILYPALFPASLRWLAGPCGGRSPDTAPGPGMEPCVPGAMDAGAQGTDTLPSKTAGHCSLYIPQRTSLLIDANQIFI